MPELILSADEVKAVLDSMESNDHCTVAYHGEIRKVRAKIKKFVREGGGLTLRRVGG